MYRKLLIVAAEAAVLFAFAGVASAQCTSCPQPTFCPPAIAVYVPTPAEAGILANRPALDLVAGVATAPVRFVRAVRDRRPRLIGRVWARCRARCN